MMLKISGALLTAAVLPVWCLAEAPHATGPATTSRAAWTRQWIADEVVLPAVESQEEIRPAAGPDAIPSPPAEEGVADPGLPEAPEPQGSGTAQGERGPEQTKRILGILPNFRSVSAGVTLPPQSAKEKLKTGFADSFDYSAVAFAGIQAGISQATDSYPAFHEGAAGYARYFWHQFADQADENLLVESLLPLALHQDSRYYTLGQGGFAKRSIYAATRVLVTRTDAGGRTVNVSELLGAGGASAISAAYYPAEYRTWTKVGQRWLTNVILDGATLYVKEFWPDINRRFAHGGP